MDLLSISQLVDRAALFLIFVHEGFDKLLICKKACIGHMQNNLAVNSQLSTYTR